MKKITFIYLFLITFSFSTIEISGDARLRPRYDMKNGTNSFYQMYRARLHINADINNGWWFQSTIGTNNIAAITKMGKVDNFTMGYDSLDITSKPMLHFLTLSYGLKTDNIGVWGGLIPIKSNPAMDIHYWSNKIVDIPWVLFNNSSTTGFAGYIKLGTDRLNWFLTVGSQEIDFNSDLNLGINYKFGLKIVNIMPHFLISMNNELSNPMTYGTKMSFNLSDLSPSLSYYQSRTDAYIINHTRALLVAGLGSGKLKAWYDYASKDSEVLQYIWLSYSYTIHQSDFGSISISPTFRRQMGKIGDANYFRNKVELTTQIKFK